MRRRTALLAPLPLLAGHAWSNGSIEPTDAEPVQKLATAWRLTGATAPDTGDRVGVIEIDWAAARVRVLAETAVPTRAHGLLPLPDGGFMAVATRPGHWLLRCDASGQVQRRLDTTADDPQRTFDGHVECSADAAWLYTVETDPGTGAGWVSVRDARTLARVAQFASGGIDPHQLLRAADGALLLANGGIVRDASGRKIDLERMAPVLSRIDPASGHLLGQWQLPDARLSMRHLAWSDGPEPLLGIALQAEHDQPQQRAEAPLLAVWDGRTLSVPSRDASGGGYAGDIAAGPGGGYVLSAQKTGQGLWWHPGRPAMLTRVAELTEPCALVSWPGAAGVTLNAARGIARWHARLPPRMLAWPVPLAPDNHAVRLVAA